MQGISVPGNRRDFLKATAWGLAALAARPLRGHGVTTDLPLARTITRGPKYHWFSYYDKLQFDPSIRYVLGMEVDFEHRSPTPDDPVRIGMVDLADGDRWIELGESRAWCWQQGCMLQWRPGSATEILWNDRDGDKFVCRILDVKSRKLRTVPHPVYSVSPCGTWAVSVDFRRVDDMRPGYGYTGEPDPYADQLAPEESGLFRVDLDTGEQTLLLSLAEIAAISFDKYDLTGAKHWFNHLLVSPDGSRFEFLNRWRMEGLNSFGTRMLTAAADGSDVRVIDPSGYTSHFIWRDPEHILAWSRADSHGDAFYLFEDREGGNVEVVGAGVMTRNGHCTYLPGNEWILNDTYPDKDRNQNPYLYHVASGRVVPLGSFHSPRKYAHHEYRCDTHPRFSPDGKLVCIDSPHTGEGRQMHLIDISGIVG